MMGEEGEEKKIGVRLREWRERERKSYEVKMKGAKDRRELGVQKKREREKYR